MSASDFELVERFFASRVGATDPTSFGTGANPARWRESDVPLTSRMAPAAVSHLLFDVWIADAPNSLAARGRDTVDELDGTVWIIARIVVNYLYRLSPTKQKASKALAMRSARDVARSVLKAQTADEDTAYGCINVQLINGLRPTLETSGEWLMIAQEFTASFDLTVRQAA
ncbi:MAG: hypothetical protein HRT76_15100 [Halieaceae bacterium]|nr:hypothetical protein [Halieaceae bacterium]